MLVGLKSKRRPKQKLEQYTRSEIQKDRSSQIKKKRITRWVENLKERLRQKLGLNKTLTRLKTCKGSLAEAQVEENREAKQLKPNEYLEFLEMGKTMFWGFELELNQYKSWSS